MRNIQVNMAFNANTSQAQSAIQQLQSSLQSIANTKVTVQGGSIDQAVQSAKLLNQHLTAATNVNTGKLDFTALQASLKGANTDLSTLTTNLLAMGPKGQQAFSQVANAVAHAGLSVKKTNAALAAFGTTLMNTIKWQAASTMIHGVMSAFSASVSHIEKLDKALSDIQIVTGKTSNEMAAFAKQAQHLSKALSSTTEEYAKASLIYFQQGLGEKEVLDRTEATIKMAKVTGEAVETVSDQLTAVWNNFDNGTKSLEYYADVLAELGAATASSTDEISDGLQKFAAVAETVGLSYEYAATALATITAETRQSADVVGTALKTLFARMEGLKLGETLDDGTTLNQYSIAMAKAGINIKDANGNLKEMDTILDEMGAKWQTLNKDQQVALAQQVGGIRQYNQLMALMDNWDTFKINLEIAKDSEGALDKQFKLYQDSVEASAQALQNAKGTLYETLFNADTLKDFNNGLTDALETITRIIKNAGGLKGLFQFGGLLLLKTVLPKLQGFIISLNGKLLDFIGHTKAMRINEMDRMSKTSHAMAGTKQQKSTGFGPINKNAVPAVDPNASSAQLRVQMMQEEAGFTAQILDKKRAIVALEDGLTAKQKEQYQQYSNQIEQQQEIVRLAREKQRLAAQESEASSKSAIKNVAASAAGRDAMVEQRDNIRTRYSTEKQALDSAYEGDMEALSKEESVAKADLASRKKDELAKLEKKSKKAKNKTSKAEVDAEMAAAEEKYNQEASELESSYGKKREARTQQYTESSGALVEQRNAALKNVTQTADLSGQATQSMAAAMQDAPGTELGAQMTQNMMSGLTQSSDGSGLAASVENLEKLGALQAEYNADIEVASGLQAEVGQEIALQEGGVKKTKQQQEALAKSSEKVTSFATKYKKELVAAVGESSDLGKEIAQLGKNGKKIDLGQLNPKQLKQLQRAMSQVEEGLGDASNAAKELGGAMAEDMAEATGKDVEIFTNVEEDAKMAKQKAIEAGQEVDKLHDKASQKLPVQPDIFGSIVQGATQAIGAFTNFAMGVQMLTTGISSAFDENASSVEKLMGWMMMLQGVMSTLNAVQAAGNMIDTVAVAIKTAKAAATKKESKADLEDTVTTGANTVATSANAVAKLFAAMASKGLAGIIAGVLGAALIVGTILLVKNTVATEKAAKADEKAAEQKQAQAEGAREAAEAAREELNAVIELTEAYMDALKVYEDTGEGKEELRKAAFEAIDAMGLEGHELEVLAGNYANLTKRIQEYNAAKAGKAVNTSVTSLSAGGSAFIAKEDISGTGGLFTAQEDGGNWLLMDLGDSGSDETALARWIEANPDTPWEINGDTVRARYSTNADIAYLMKEFYRMYDGVSAIATAQEQRDMEFFSEAQEMRDSGSWEMGQELAAAYDTHTDTAITGAKATHLTGVETQAGYNEAYKEMVNYALQTRKLLDSSGQVIKGREAEAEAIIAQLETNLSKDEEWADYELKRRGLNAIATKYNKSAAADFIKEDVSGSNALYDWAEANNIDKDDAIDMFLKINPQYYENENQLVEALDRMQAWLDANKLIIKFDLIAGAKSALKETMSSADWSSFYTQYKELFDPSSANYIGISFEEFTNKSHQDRIGLLNNNQGNKVELLDTQIATAEGNLVAASRPDSRENFIAEYKKDATQEYRDAVEELRNEVKTQYTADQIKNFTDNGEGEYGAYLGEVSRYENGIGDGPEQMTQAEYDFINEWAIGKGWNNADEYLQAKSRYLNAMNGVNGNYFGGYGYGLSNLNLNAPDATELQGKAEAAYDEYLGGLRTEIAGYEAERHLAILAQADAAITDYDLDAEEVYNTSNALSEMAESSDEVADGLKHDTAAAKMAAVEIARFNKAVDLVADGYEDWTAALNSGSLSAITKATSEMKIMYANLLNMDTSDFSDAFLRDAENLELAFKAASGDVEAYNALQGRALEYMGQQFAAYTSTVVSSLQQIAAIEGIDVGEKLIYTDAGDDLATRIAMDYMRAYQAAIAGGKDVAEAQAYAANMINQAGYNVTSPLSLDPANMEERTVTITGSLPVGWTPVEGGSIIGPDGQPIPGVEWKATEGGQYTYTQTMLVPKGAEFTKTSETFGGDTSQITGEGSGSKAEPTRKADVIERYKEVTDKINDVQREMEKASTAADRLWGPDRVAAMEDVNEALAQNIDLLKDKRAEAEYHLTTDKNALREAIKDNAGLTFSDESFNNLFDENGNFTGYNEILGGLYQELSRAESAAGDEWSDSEKDKIEKIKARIEAVKSAIENYDETNTTIKDLNTEIQDAIYEWQDNNYQILAAELEFKININDSQLEVVDYYLSKMENDMFAYTEAMGYYNQQSNLFNSNLEAEKDYLNSLMESYFGGTFAIEDYLAAVEEQQKQQQELTQLFHEGKISLEEYQTQMDALSEGIVISQDAFISLNDEMVAGSISEADYKQGLADIQSEIISNLESLESSKQAMQDYYGNVMAMAIEEIGLYTAEMEQLNTVLDHYSSIMEIIGKQDDFATKNKILTAKANNIKNELTVQNKLYEDAAADAEHWAEKMRELESTMTPEQLNDSNAYQTYKKNWQAAQEAANTAQDEMLAKTAEWAEAMKAIIENELSDFAATLEESLTGGTSFDELLTSMERRSTLQEEYLTTTNKIYETNKMMRTAQQEIDKTTNTVAKKRLQSFINETGELQNQTKLSKYELEIQQAKYDLLLAEIALEEAQNAKSTVRLQRDSEGNIGYVYTADSAAVSAAEQKLADAQNNLYNIGLEGANNYQQKYAETLQESQDAITELTQMWMNGEITSEEEFNRRKQEIVEYYGEKLKQYSELHAIALTTDTNVVSDAWSTEFLNMTASVGDWQTAVDGYFESAAGSMQTWAEVCATTLEDSKLKDVDSALKDIDDKSKALITTLLGEDGESGLVGALLEQVDAASKISESQIVIQDAIDKTITYFENLLIAVNNAYTAMTTPITPAISLTGGEYNPDSTYTTYDPDGTRENTQGTYDNQGYATAYVKTAQSYVGATADGKWGEDSCKKAKAKCGSDRIADVLAHKAAAEAEKNGGGQEPVSRTPSTTRGGAITIDNGGGGPDMGNPNLDRGITAVIWDGDGGGTADNSDPPYEAGDKVKFHGSGISYLEEHGSIKESGTWPAQSAFYSATPLVSGYKSYQGKRLYKHPDQNNYKNLWIDEKDLIKAFDTGGYTGSWAGSYGKLAMLHQKELVLNPGDTENFLASMSILERILQVLDLQSASVQLGGILSTPGFGNYSNNGTLEQNVHIEANFPNATNHNEIEEAFSNLVNLASQYANRK